jgi:transposase
VDVSTARRWVARFSSGDSDVKDKPRSGRPCKAVTPRNEERLDRFIRANGRITTRELCMELNVGFSELETMVATLEYRKVCVRWVPRKLALMCLRTHNGVY